MKRQKLTLFAIGSVVLSIGIVSFVTYKLLRGPNKAHSAPVEFKDTAKQVTPDTADKPVEEPAKPAQFNSAKLQDAVNAWSNTIAASAKASVVLSDDSGALLASYNSEEQYFTASLYKLFVAYEGYRALDVGTYDGGQSYLSGKSRLECLDLMIRESNSPCGEKWWNELGKQTIQSQLKTYGIKQTDMVGLKTTATDTAKMLARIAKGEGLSKTSHTSYLDSMKTQPALYRKGLPSGFSQSVTVYNKVGWNEQVEWHDASIVELADGRTLVIAVLTSGVGSAKIAELAKNIEATF